MSAKLQRWEMYGCSWQSVPEWGNTQRSRGTPNASARAALHMMSAAAMSTSLLEFIDFVYGKPIIRLRSVGVRISSAVIAVRSHACGLFAATSEKRDHSSLATTCCSSTVRPAAARMAVSNIGYTCTGMAMPRASSASWFIVRSSPMSRGMRPSGAFGQPSVATSTPAALARPRVRHASPPISTARSHCPAAISSAVAFTSDCGLLPPMVVTAVSRGSRPSRSATTHAGSP